MNPLALENLNGKLLSKDIPDYKLQVYAGDSRFQKRLLELTPFKYKIFEVISNRNNVDKWHRTESYTLENLYDGNYKEQIINNINKNIDIDMVYFSDATQKYFYEQLKENGINISKEQKDIINQLMNSIDYEKTMADVLLNEEYSYDIKEYINQNKEKGKEELIKRILVKEINDKYLLGKDLSELNEDEKRLIAAKIDDEKIETVQYDITIATKDWKGNLQIGENGINIIPIMSEEYEKNEQLLRSRLGDRKHFTEGYGFATDLGTIKPNEKLGDYINRLKKYYKMIQEQIEGDKEINFDEQEQGKEEKNVEKETAEAEVDNLKKSYEQSGTEPTDLKKARKQLETDLNKDQNQAVKNGEENDEH